MSTTPTTQAITIATTRAPRKRMTNGNVKVKALLFSLTPVVSCLNSATCASTCYAVKSHRQYPSVRNLWDDNLDLANNNLWALYDDLRAQLKTTKQTLVRIHQSGDFVSQAYVDMWATLAREFTSLTFYYYTKVDHLFDFSRLNTLSNVSEVQSMLNGKRNYGSLGYVQRLAEETGAVICPATHGDDKKDIKCGLNCTACMVKGAKVVFVQH